MKKYKWTIAVPVIIAAALAFAFWYGGSAPGTRGWDAGGAAADLREGSPDVAAAAPEAAGTPTGAVPTPTAALAPDPDAPDPPDATPSPDTAPGEGAAPSPPEKEPAVATQPDGTDSELAQPSPEAAPGADLGRPMSAEEKTALARELAGGESSLGVVQGDSEYSAVQGMQINPETGKDRYQTSSVPEGRPVPVEPQDVIASDKALTCTLSVRCDTILDNISWLDPEKVELVPPDGVIFPVAVVTFYEGESVFNVLWREMKRAGIHFEFVDTPLYNSAYIEGINNLYEFDCGELSGWMYKVNDWFPNYGCSRYQLKDGDIVEWVYTCDLGVDVGGYYSVGG
ncbi:MAG: DUF4430 domain-containing protein [Oscillospiraceae bacterium]|jgi:hypothetical protein|nr:DUF4430 domain-containing protein [Oscillospiraceae bacterium]